MDCHQKAKIKATWLSNVERAILEVPRWILKQWVDVPFQKREISNYFFHNFVNLREYAKDNLFIVITVGKVGKPLVLYFVL